MDQKAEGQTIEELEIDAQEPEAEVLPDGQSAESEDDEIVVTIDGEESPPAGEEHVQAPEWVRELRKQNREDKKRIRELEEKLNTKVDTEIKPVSLGKKPTLEDCDWDSERFEQEITSWHDKKRQIELAEEQKRKDEQAQVSEWQKKLEGYNQGKQSLKAKDFDDVEAEISTVLNVTQQGLILQGADNPALVVYALGKNPKKAKEIAAINDPVKFAFAVAKLEAGLKVSNRKTPPPPEKIIASRGGTSGAVDSTLDRLRADAEKTGDYTKVLKYKQQQKKTT